MFRGHLKSESMKGQQRSVLTEWYITTLSMECHQRLTLTRQLRRARLRGQDEANDWPRWRP
jgi:hypothetical protein